MGNINLVVIHCSASQNGRKLGRPGESAAEVINRWHKDRGFKRGSPIGPAAHLQHIGYHWVIDIDGQVYNGRDESEVGAHVGGWNAGSLSVCLVGSSQYTKNQWESLAGMFRSLSAKHGLALRHPSLIKNGVVAKNQKGFCGHRDLSPDLNKDGLIKSQDWLKTCPGFSVQDFLNSGLKPVEGSIFGV